MGYNVDVTTEVQIPISKEKDVKKAFKDLASKASSIGRGYSGGKKQFGFVDFGFENLDTVEEMFEAWRYSVKRTDTHFVVEYFEGQSFGDDNHLWKAMESVVTPDSVVEFHGEDGSHWKYIFKKNKFKEIQGEVQYEEDDDDKEEVSPKKNKSQKKLDPYKLLGVTKSSTKEEINKAYKLAAKKYHPDNFSTLGTEFEEIATIKMKELNSARDACLKAVK